MVISVFFCSIFHEITVKIRTAINNAMIINKKASKMWKLFASFVFVIYSCKKTCG